MVRLCALGLVLVWVGLAHGANLVFDSSFEDAVDAGTIAEGWETAGTPPGGVNAVSDRRAHSGRFSHQLTVPEDAPVNWYQVRQSVPLLAPGQTITLSVYVAGENVRDGAGAYCSINCFAGDERIGIFDAASHVTGTSADWQRQSVTATIPPRTNQVVTIFTLHGHGTAWFDDVQLEQGGKLTAYQTSAVDQEAAARAAEQRRQAETLAQTLQVTPGKLGTVAILRDTLPADGTASSPERLAQWLGTAGYGTCFVNAEQISNPFILRGPASLPAGSRRSQVPPFDLLVLPYGGAFPATAAGTIKSYLRQRGAFIAMGGYAFDTLLVPHEGRWLKPQDLPLPAGGGVSLIDFSTPEETAETAWSLGSDAGGNKPALRAATGPRAGVGALEFTVTPLRLWATAARDIQSRLPAAAATDGRQWTVTRFWARGDADTPKMAFEWDEVDASRWKVSLPLTTEWKEYVLTPADLTYWPDNPSVGRGGAGDRFHPERARSISLGLALDIVDRDKPHSFQIADLRVQADPLGELRSRPKCLNTRSAKIRDAMWPDADQIPAFDPANTLEFVTGARPMPDQFVAPAGNWTGKFAGYSAVAMTSNQGHGFGPNLSRLVPLLQCTDRFGRSRGYLGSLVYPYDGFYRGSAYAIFGVTSQDLFTEANPQAKALLTNTAAALTRRVFLHDTDTEFSSYRDGETVRFRTKVSNFGMTEAAVTVGLALGPAAFGQPREVVLKPGATEDVSVEVPVEQLGGAPLCRFSFTAAVEGKPIDREANAVVVWQDGTASGAGRGTLAPVTRRGPYFAFGSRPMFVLGSQTYWGQNGSVTARSPLAFERDFAMMQDYGMHFSRLFVPFKTDSDMRQSDAMVQLAQQHRILFYHTPNLPNTTTPEQLAEETAIAGRIGERYRDVPWLTVDICNEPTVAVSDEKLGPAFNEYLRTLYPTTEALRAAWGVNDVELGQVKLQPLSDRWDDLRSYDTHRFMTLVQQRWADANRAAIRQADPERLVSVGEMQGTGDAHTVWDPPICHANLDFTDRHYYGPTSAFPAQLKDIDQRVLGKPMLQGECGAKDHPTYAAADPWGMGDDDERYNHRFAYLVHHAFGLGATALSSWHWRDPIEGIFPCGQVRSDRVPRPSASVMRSMAFTFGRLRPVFEVPQVVLVVPETHRLGGSRVMVTNAIHRAEEVLMGCHVDFGMISEGRLSELPAQVKTLVYPVPYCPPDEVVTALRAFVERGGALYFSGDISYDPQRKLTRAQRLVELAGVERKGVKDPQAAPCATTTLVEPKTAELLSGVAPDGVAVALQKLGGGQVMLCSDPVETAKDQLSWHRPLMLDFLERADVSRNAITPDEASLHCFRVALEGGGAAYVLYNATDAPLAATLTLTGKQAGNVQLALAAESPGLVVVDHEGRLVAVETQGEVKRNGRSILKAQGHVIIQSLDGRDLADCHQALILPFPGHGAVPPMAKTGAAITWAGLNGKRVELGELQATKWTRLEPLQVKGAVLGYDAEQALQMILAATPAEFDAAKAVVESFATNP